VELLAWLIFGLVLVLLAGLYLGRDHIIQAVPAAERAYRVLGLTASPVAGLELRRHGSRPGTQDGRPVLIVEGEIHNAKAAARPAPRVRVGLVDERDQEVAFGLFTTAEATIEPDGIATFRAELLDPPSTARSYRITLVPGG
jgi:hypothetical protein